MVFPIGWYSVALLFLISAQALQSQECINKALSLGTEQKQGRCPQPVCGALDIPETSESFLNRMSPQCQDVMKQYRRLDVGTPLGLHLDVNNETRKQKGGHSGPCPERRGATTPTNPVVVQAPGVRSFVICTVPKSGCTSLRKLMHAVINNGKRTPESSLSVPGNPHRHDYATLWHYEHSEVPADVYPSFIVGRCCSSWHAVLVHCVVTLYEAV